MPCLTKASPPSPPTSRSPWLFPARKTLLIDGDLRRGALREAFEISSKIGFSEVLKQEVNWQEVVVPTSYPSLFVLPRGKTLSQPSEHLLRESTDRLLQDIYNHYDYIIIDSSPVLAADDTTSLAPKIDATLFVVRLSYTSARLTKKVARAALQPPGQCAGRDSELRRYLAAGILLLPVLGVLQHAGPVEEHVTSAAAHRQHQPKQIQSS